MSGVVIHVLMHKLMWPRRSGDAVTFPGVNEFRVKDGVTIEVVARFGLLCPCTL